MKKAMIGLCVLGFTLGGACYAQEAPAPRKMPRVPVHRQSIVDQNLPLVRQIQGQATIIDTEKLRIGDVELRLFGIVPPQLSASFGPQARATLDSATAGKVVTCQIRDRDQTGRFLAVCKNDTNNDLALELLQRGLAVTARGSLTGTDMLLPYLASEQAAQVQKIGLWSVVIPAPAVISETTKTEISNLTSPKVDTKEEKAANKSQNDDVHTKTAAPSAVAAANTHALPVYETPNLNNEHDFVSRYQILIAALLMLTTALSILVTFAKFRRSEKREEIRAIAAALRGELMAARAVCQARLKSIASPSDDKATNWPRIRSTIYQAYVNRLGWLGAELARQIASIYGQSNDYAAYYTTNEEQRTSIMPKRQALETLTHHIEAVLPKLARIEETGQLLRDKKPMMRTTPSVPHDETHTNALESTAISAQAVSEPTAIAIVDVEDKALPNKSSPSSPLDDATRKVASLTSLGSQPGSLHDRLSPTPLWKAMRDFTRDHLIPHHDDAMENQIPDYTTLLEEEMAEMSFSVEEELDEPLSGHVSKIRETGS